jgi:hydroxymethylglutaryl-CoA lyase
MQGWPVQIPTEKKIEYLQTLLGVGFHALDCGSFVSPKAVPQMADTAEVINALDLSGTKTKLLTIVANVRGAETACKFNQVDFVGYPFSISETFQQRNTNAGIEASLEVVKQVAKLCMEAGKKPVVYISMGFGNPYGDSYSYELVTEWINKIIDTGVRIISLADTVGVATAQQVYDLYSVCRDNFPGIEIGVHLHAKPDNWKSKIDAALRAGCYRIDSAMKGIGGCPFANDHLVGNINTEELVQHIDAHQWMPMLNKKALKTASELASEIF